MIENEKGKIEQNYGSHTMSEESIAEYLAWEREKGLSEKMIRFLKGPVLALYKWLPEEKQINKDVLKLWREDMISRNFSKNTIGNYVKNVNRYLDYYGCSHMRFNRGRSHDLTNMTFGHLTALEATEERYRKDVVWLCQCKCGNLCKVPATRLVTAHTLSCGCLRAEHLNSVNKYIAETSIRSAMEDKIKSEYAKSGYTGVYSKRGNWCARIKYRGKNYNLGSFSSLDKAVRARSVAKQLVQEDAEKLEEVYEEIHKDDKKPPRTRTFMKKPPSGSEKVDPQSRAMRSDNKSGYTGVFKRYGKWTAKITYKKKSYILGNFEEMEDAISARKEAEQMLKADPQRFVEYCSENYTIYTNK